MTAVTYEMTEPGFVVVWQDEFTRGEIYGPIEPDVIQDFIDAYPGDDYDDVIGYSPSELAAQMGQTFLQADAPIDVQGNYKFYVNDPTTVGEEDVKLRLYRLTVVPVPDEVTTTPLEFADFRVRTYNALKKNRVDTLEQLADLSAEDILDIRNLGISCLTEIQAALYSRGMDLRSEKIGVQVSKLARVRGHEWDWEWEPSDPAGHRYERRPTLNFSTDLIKVRDEGHTVWSVLSAGDYLKGDAERAPRSTHCPDCGHPLWDTDWNFGSCGNCHRSLDGVA